MLCFYVVVMTSRWGPRSLRRRGPVPLHRDIATDSDDAYSSSSGSNSESSPGIVVTFLCEEQKRRQLVVAIESRTFERLMQLCKDAVYVASLKHGGTGRDTVSSSTKIPLHDDRRGGCLTQALQPSPPRDPKSPLRVASPLNDPRTTHLRGLTQSRPNPPPSTTHSDGLFRASVESEVVDPGRVAPVSEAQRATASGIHRVWCDMKASSAPLPEAFPPATCRRCDDEQTGRVLSPPANTEAELLRAALISPMHITAREAEALYFGHIRRPVSLQHQKASEQRELEQERLRRKEEDKRKADARMALQTLFVSQQKEVNSAEVNHRKCIERSEETSRRELNSDRLDALRFCLMGGISALPLLRQLRTGEGSSERRYVSLTGAFLSGAVVSLESSTQDEQQMRSVIHEEEALVWLVLSQWFASTVAALRQRHLDTLNRRWNAAEVSACRVAIAALRGRFDVQSPRRPAVHRPDYQPMVILTTQTMPRSRLATRLSDDLAVSPILSSTASSIVSTPADGVCGSDFFAFDRSGRAPASMFGVHQQEQTPGTRLSFL